MPIVAACHRTTSKKFSMRRAYIAALTVFLMGFSTNVWACASCGCTLSCDWDTLQISSTPGVKLDIRYDYLDQNQLWSGDGPISASRASKRTNDGEPQEVEKYTINNYVTLGADYNINADWGVSLLLPFIDRNHLTLGTASDGDDPGPGGGQYKSHTTNLGDMRLIGRYQGFLPKGNLGVTFGVKLPTGSYTLTGDSTDPTAPGDVVIDRGLQPGTGTTDLIVGAFYADSISEHWNYFTQAIFQTALYSKDDYRPGNSVNFNAGLRYAGFTFITPQIQVNYKYVERDSGANADTFSTGGSLVYASAGAVVPIGDKFSVYGFAQIPVYQYVRGVQLVQRYSTTFGMRYSF